MLKQFLKYLFEEDHSELLQQYRTGVMGKSTGFDWYRPHPVTRLDRFAAQARAADLSHQFFKPITLDAKIRRIFIH